VRIGVARVSTRDQNPESQIDALRAAGCEKIFTDKASGKLARRPELDKALLVARAGDQIVVTKLDRLGRSLENLIELSKQLQESGVGLVVLDQGIDTTTAIGRMFFQILGAIAEFEHALMSERTVDGLAAARARGRRCRASEREALAVTPLAGAWMGKSAQWQAFDGEHRVGFQNGA
jgi:DNA invertase Pin-like site-specific DNA recombinase